jgi:mono/diheme cytochrome c family protein
MGRAGRARCEDRPYFAGCEQACNADGCKPGDLFTPRVESDWLRVSVRDAEDLKNTTLDCRQCHQRDDRIRFMLSHTFGVALENIVNRAQPLLFDTPKIEQERWPIAEDGSYPTTPLASATWDELPDLADIFPDDPLTRAKIGLQNEPGATPAQALVQVCGSCHNDVLDQTISRARFNIDLWRMARAELDSAIDRLQRATHHVGAMPPPETRQLDSAALAALIDYLRQDRRSPEDDAFLQHAAISGMKGGAEP